VTPYVTFSFEKEVIGSEKRKPALFTTKLAAIFAREGCLSEEVVLSIQTSGPWCIFVSKYLLCGFREENIYHHFLFFFLIKKTPPGIFHSGNRVGPFHFVQRGVDINCLLPMIKSLHHF